ncbi:MAG: hypothetical protein NVS1B10_04780 [Candidatus Saccharimonadales bacterium]
MNSRKIKLTEFLNKPLALGLVALLLFAKLVILIDPVSAASLKITSLRDSRMASAANGGLRLVFQAATTGAPGTFTINMNGADSTTWTGSTGTVNATQNTNIASCAADTGATGLPGTLSASGSGSTITITGVTSLTATTNYCVDLIGTGVIATPNGWNAVANPNAGEYHPVITSGADTVTVAVRIASSSPGDQVTVNAVVPPTFNLVIGGCTSNIDNFTANLSTSAVISTGGCTLTINTNAKTGWYAWAKDSNVGLTSAAVSKTIASVATGATTTLVANGTNENYGFGVTNITQGSGAGTATAASAYDATATGGANATVGGLDATVRQIASSTGTASGAILTVKERAVVANITPAAADYTDTITLIGAGSF